MNTATEKLHSIAREKLRSGEAENIDDALVAAVQSNPELYTKSLEEGDKPEPPREVMAALASLSSSERAEVERKATEIYLRNPNASETDAVVLAIQQTPGVHVKCMNASPVRKDTLEKIRAMREQTEKKSGMSAWLKLKDIAAGYQAQGAGDEDEAFCKACEDNPRLFEEWQDSQAKPGASNDT